MRWLRLGLIVGLVGSAFQGSGLSASTPFVCSDSLLTTNALTAASLFFHRAYSVQTFYWCHAAELLAVAGLTNAQHPESFLWAASVAPLLRSIPHHQFKESTPDAFRHWEERQAWPDLLRATFARSAPEALALLDEWLSQKEPSRLAVERMIRLPEEGGTLRPDELTLRRFVWQRLLANRFGGTQHIVYYAQRLKKGYARPANVEHLPKLPFSNWRSLGHFVLIMRLPPNGAFYVSQSWPSLAPFADRDVAIEFRDGFPVCAWCDDVAAMRIFFRIMTRTNAQAAYQIQAVHGGNIKTAIWNTLNDALVEADVDGYGTLNLAGGPPEIDGTPSKTRLAWFTIHDGRSGHERVRLTVRQALPWNAAFLETERLLYFQMVYDRIQQRFTTARYGRFNAKEVSQFDARHVLAQYRLGPSRIIHWGNRRIPLGLNETFIGKFATIFSFANPSGKNSFITSVIVKEKGHIVARITMGLLYAACEADPTSFQLGPLIGVFHRLTETNALLKEIPNGGIAIKRLSKYGITKIAGYNVHLERFPSAIVAFRISPTGVFMRLLFDAYNVPILDAKGHSITLNVTHILPKSWLRHLGGRMNARPLILAKHWVNHLPELQSWLEANRVSIDDVRSFLSIADDQLQCVRGTIPDVLKIPFLILSNSIGGVCRFSLQTVCQGLTEIREAAQRFLDAAYALASEGMSRKQWDPWVEGIHLLRQHA